MYISLVSFFSSFSLTNDVDVQHRLLNVPNGPVTNGVMTYAIPTEGNTVTDHSYDERLNPHVTPDSVTSHVTSDTTGSTLLTTKENGHSSQEHCNGDNSFTKGEESNQPAQQLHEEKSETVAKNDQGQVEWEEAPEKESKEDLPESNVTESLAEQKESTSQEEEQVPTSEQSKSFSLGVILYSITSELLWVTPAIFGFCWIYFGLTCMCI